MPDLLYYTLVVCLVLSNLNRIIWAVKTIYEYLTRPRAPQLVPYFDENGKFYSIFFSRRSNIQTGFSGNLIGMVRVPVDALERLRGNDRSPATEIPAIDNSNAPASTATTPDNSAAARRKSKSNLTASSHSPEVIPETLFTWDCWPDGDLRFSLTAEQFYATQDLGTNWVMETTRTKGSSRAKNWLKGRETRRRCLGAIKCQGSNCSMHLVPAARKIERFRQLEEKCVECRSSLTSCNVETSLFQFAGGYVFVNYGVHTHTTFTHSTALKPDGSLAFADFNPRFQDDSDSDHSNRSYNENEPNTAASQMQIFSDRGFSVHSADARHEPQGEGEFRDAFISSAGSKQSTPVDSAGEEEDDPDANAEESDG
ncbi:hypothetical protein R3P38DRAFT_3185270 [Favolaschia claudopus]|uniref:Uncharacterized protein n=1 Tax=Favolaschia claudopus TaxID=2862362 RepID=A0AAW0C5F5_9AGAR